MSGHTLPPTGSRPCTLNSAKVLWVQKRSVKQRGRAAGGHRLVFEPNTCVTACVTLYLSVTYAQGNTSTSLDFIAPEQQSAVFPLTSPQLPIFHMHDVETRVHCLCPLVERGQPCRKMASLLICHKNQTPMHSNVLCEYFLRKVWHERSHWITASASVVTR